MKLKIKAPPKIVGTVDSGDLDAFITHTFGHEFCCEADQEWGNDEIHTVYADPKYLLPGDREKVEEFRKTGRGQFLLQDIMAVLAEQGVIPTGEYQVENSY